MGMFDWLKCHTLLPDFCNNDHLFQTKSFENSLSNYTITEEGILTVDIVEHSFQESDGPLGDVEYDTVVEEKSPTNYNGVVHFYYCDGRGANVHFFALFDQGHMKAVLNTSPDTTEEEGDMMVRSYYEKHQIKNAMPSARRLEQNKKM